jgi:hypothetical protein
MPTTTPSAIVNTAAVNAIINEVRSPYTTWMKMSRPMPGWMPNQCSPETPA